MPRIRAATIAEHRERTRAEILEAAVETFTEFGYSDASLGDVAALVGIGRTTMYEYFADKEDLLVVMVEGTVPAVIDAMIDEIPADLAHADRLAELIVRSLEFVSDDANLGALIMREAPKLSPPAQDRIARAHGRIRAELVAICEDGVAGGEFRSLDPGRVADLVNAAMMVASRTLIRSREPKQHVHELADELVELLFGGLLVDGRRGR